MKNKKISLAYSPCPNDTFIFYPLIRNLINTGGYKFYEVLKDVETLNKEAFKNIHNITKLSFAALGHLQDNYALLKSGAALGRGCGPLIVAREDLNMNNIKKNKIAVPGVFTTANLLLSLFLNQSPNVAPISFEQIMPAVSSGKFNCGVIIHEGRFTYKQYGLKALVDLGSWWENKTNLPIPLGGIAVQRELGKKHAKEFENIIKKSVEYGFANNRKAVNYIKKHAREIDDQVIKSHIDLYVNDFTLDIGEQGETAINALFETARSKGIIPKSDLPLFIT
ncbi:MAG: 1,4-dihydroxy-6-naphthoate synthase [Deltaproteobacteria bacterium]|nr:1,4-dihydroxy-6-naphthoate synthase [Deltaproteobacteria bacterium]